MFKPTWGWTISTAACVGAVALVGVVLDASWPAIVALSAGTGLACVSSLVLYHRRNPSAKGK